MDSGINNEQIADLKSWFSTYVNGFKSGNSELRRNAGLKEDHTVSVCKEILKLGKQLDLNDDRLRLAEVIALFHDIGRFEQYARYRTFADQKSEDHAELGISILKKFRVFDGFEVSIRNLIYRTILYHNHAVLPDKESESCLLFTKLLRDADKLDIWRVVTAYYHRKEGGRNDAIELDLPDTPGISEGVCQDLIHERIVEMNHVRNLNDLKLLQAGWIFDVNFEPTLQAVKSRRYMDLIREVLPRSEKIQKIFDVIQASLDERPGSSIG